MATIVQPITIDDVNVALDNVDYDVDALFAHIYDALIDWNCYAIVGLAIASDLDANAFLPVPLRLVAIWTGDDDEIASLRYGLDADDVSYDV